MTKRWIIVDWEGIMASWLSALETIFCAVTIQPQEKRRTLFEDLSRVPDEEKPGPNIDAASCWVTTVADVVASWQWYIFCERLVLTSRELDFFFSSSTSQQRLIGRCTTRIIFFCPIEVYKSRPASLVPVATGYPPRAGVDIGSKWFLGYCIICVIASRDRFESGLFTFFSVLNEHPWIILCIFNYSFNLFFWFWIRHTS